MSNQATTDMNNLNLKGDLEHENVGNEDKPKNRFDDTKSHIFCFGDLKAENLCDVCHINDFTALFINPDAYLFDDPGYRCAARTISHIQQHSTQGSEFCRFCLLTNLCLVSLKLTEVPNSGDFTVTSSAWPAGGIFRETDGILIRNHPVTLPYVRIAFEVSEYDVERSRVITERDLGGGFTRIELRMTRGYRKTSEFSLQLFFESGKPSSSIPLSGRPLAHQINFKLVGSWLDCLTTAKDLECTPLEIKLIDVVKGKLVDADTNFTYVALSYVWGGYSQTMLNADTLALFHSDGFITETSPLLSWTIKDAISVCRKLNIQYLWVDCLCIQQDDIVSKMSQVERMDDIYGRATFTIVNAGHQQDLNANSPLPGVRPSTRNSQQFMARTERFSILGTPCPRLQDDLEQSAWRSRAWTFQEELLSRALLIFTSRQCFLQAGNRLFCEDQIFENDEKGVASIPTSGSMSGGTSYHLRAEGNTLGDFDLEDYCLLIESYTKRKLTYQGDSIKAALGILRRFADKFDGRNSRLISGHPSAAFDYSLCWTANSIWTKSRRSDFPSWSWASHEQHVEFDLGHNINRHMTFGSPPPLATSLYTDALSDGCFTLNQIATEQTGVDILPVKKADAEIQLYYNSRGLDATLADSEIHFSTTRVRFRVSRYCSRHGEKFDDPRSEHAEPWGAFFVYTHDSDPASTSKEIGHIYLESEWRDEQPHDMYLDFIVIRAIPGPEPFSFHETRGESIRAEVSLGMPHGSFADESSVGSLSVGQESDSKLSRPERRFTALRDPRLDSKVEANTGTHAQRLNKAGGWKLCLMGVEWSDVVDGAGNKRETRRVARRMDILRFGPTVDEWIAFGPERIDVVLA